MTEATIVGSRRGEVILGHGSTVLLIPGVDIVNTKY